MTPEQKKVYETALKYFGVPNQQIKTMEESGELIQALAKNFDPSGCILNNAVLEELADVQIMIHQMSLLYGEAFDCKVIEKTNRLSMRIQSGCYESIVS